MIKKIRLTTAALALLSCNLTLGETAGDIFAGNCENGGGAPGSLPIFIGIICVGTGMMGDNFTIGRTTFNAPLSPIDNNSSAAVAATSKDIGLDVTEERRDAARKSSAQTGGNSENVQFSNLLGKMNIFANVSRASGNRKNELIATERVGSTTMGQDSLNDPETYIRPAIKSLGFSYDITNANAGIDFRLSRNWLTGIVLGYNERNTDQVDSPSYSKYTDTQLALMLSYAADNGFYADVLVGHGKGKQRYGREFSFSLAYVSRRDCLPEDDPDYDEYPCVSETNITFNPLATAKAGSKVRTLAASTGFEIAMRSSTLTPFLKLESSKQTLSDYRESAQITNELLQTIEQVFIDAFLLRVFQHNIDSTSLSAGLEYNRIVTTNWGVVIPKITLTSIHQLEDQKPIRASFLYNEQRSFLTETPALDDQYWNLGLSTNLTMPDGLMFYALAEKMIGHSQLDQWTWAVGLRKEL